jgi:formylglycine-generating enzyme required for sulfatase activity
MGTDRGQEDERPPHRVFVDPFELAVFPVTRAEYACFADATGHEPPRDWSHPPFAQPDLPVVGEGLEFVVRQRLGAGRGPGSERPTAHG